MVVVARPRGADGTQLSGPLERTHGFQDKIGDLVERLFLDAKATGKRVTARGAEYSILDNAIQEFTSWYGMSWE